jgi:predicted nucleic acid-binding Zn ribbon protein
VKRAAPRRLSAALEGLEVSLQPASLLARVQRVWEQAAGPTVAAAGRPSAERDGVLTIVCSDAVWAQELELMGADLVERLNEVLGEPLLQRLRCRTG